MLLKTCLNTIKLKQLKVTREGCFRIIISRATLKNDSK